MNSNHSGESESYDLVIAKGFVALFFILLLSTVILIKVVPWMKAPEETTVALELDEIPIVKFESEDNSTEISVSIDARRASIPFVGKIPLRQVKRVGLLKEGYSAFIQRPEQDNNISIIKTETKENVGMMFTAPRTINTEFFNIQHTEGLEPAIISSSSNCSVQFIDAINPQNDNFYFINIKGVSSFTPMILTNRNTPNEDIAYKLLIRAKNIEEGYSVLPTFNPGIFATFNNTGNENDCRFDANFVDDKPSTGLFVLARHEFDDSKILSTAHVPDDVPFTIWFDVKQTMDQMRSGSITITNNGQQVSTFLKPKGFLYVGDKQIKLEGQSTVRLIKTKGESNFSLTDLGTSERKMKLDFNYEGNNPMGSTSKFESVRVNDNEIIASRWDTIPPGWQSIIIGASVAMVGLLGNVMFSAASVSVLRVTRRMSKPVTLLSSASEGIQKIYKHLKLYFSKRPRQ